MNASSMLQIFRNMVNDVHSAEPHVCFGSASPLKRLGMGWRKRQWPSGPKKSPADSINSLSQKYEILNNNAQTKMVQEMQIFLSFSQIIECCTVLLKHIHEMNYGYGYLIPTHCFMDHSKVSCSRSTFFSNTQKVLSFKYVGGRFLFYLLLIVNIMILILDRGVCQEDKHRLVPCYL